MKWCSLACGIKSGGVACGSFSVIANNCKACIKCLKKESLVSYFVLYHVIFFVIVIVLFRKFGLVHYF